MRRFSPDSRLRLESDMINTATAARKAIHFPLPTVYSKPSTINHSLYLWITMCIRLAVTVSFPPATIGLMLR